jgi:peptidoglycan/LPS O-acetylase OafA/YrhL
MWNIVGYAGSLLILLAFIMVTRAKWKPQSFIYLLVSFFGAVFLAVYQVKLGAFAGVLLNVVFAGVAVWGIVTIARSQPNNKKRKNRQ